ncbi:hypothetical protein KR018_000458, partial [Drosophila ironensis]
RVHIRLHMPEVVRQHTHFHNVYKYARKIPFHPAPAPPPTTIASLHPKFPGKPHVQLLGYTTAVGGSGPMSPNLMQLMATAAAPTLMPTPTGMTPNYGPALFDNYNQEVSALSATTTTTTARPQVMKASKQQQQLLQQIFTPQQTEEEETSAENNPMENNSLLNQNFLEALQREYLAKFGGRRKRKKSGPKKYKNPNKDYGGSNYQNKPYYYQDEDSSENFEDYQDEPTSEDYEEVMMMSNPPKYGGYYTSGSDEMDQDNAQGYDNAVAFSGQDNSITSTVPTMEEFLEDVSSPGSGFSGYDPYGNSNEIMSQSWHPSPTVPTMGSSWSGPTGKPYSNFSKAPKSRPVRSRGRTKIRFVKLVTRKKRKNHIRAKRYRT